MPVCPLISGLFLGRLGAPRQVGCSMEFVGFLLDHLRLTPNYLVSYLQQGNCYQCSRQFQQVDIYNSVQLISFSQIYPDPILHLPMPQTSTGDAPLDLRPLIQTALAAPVNSTLTCLLGCGPQLLQCSLIQQPGQVQIIDLVRIGHSGTVSFFHLICYIHIKRNFI